jgi:hypothetical protein
MLVQVVGTSFRLMDTYASLWRESPLPRTPRIYGIVRPVVLDPVAVHLDGMTARFKQGVSDLAGIHDAALAPATAREVRALANGAMPGGAPDFTDQAWCRVVYDFAVAHHRRRMPAELLLSALVPLYLGRVAAFVARHAESDTVEVEEAVEALCSTFLAEREYLTTRWEETS